MNEKIMAMFEGCTFEDSSLVTAMEIPLKSSKNKRDFKFSHLAARFKNIKLKSYFHVQRPEISKLELNKRAKLTCKWMNEIASFQTKHVD